MRSHVDVRAVGVDHHLRLRGERREQERIEDCGVD